MGAGNVAPAPVSAVDSVGHLPLTGTPHGSAVVAAVAPVVGLLVAAGGEPPHAASRVANTRMSAMSAFFISLLSPHISRTSVAAPSDRLVWRRGWTVLAL